MSAYYNEHDKFSAAWLRELIAADVIAGGEVDERNIQEVRADELRGFTQCHFFAGIGVWSYALRCADWPDDKPAWTGSCPCQPFSVSGKRAGASDGRHLWPYWFPLIRESRPSVIFGEQVASDDGLAWLDLVSSDLERSDYAVGAVDTCAAGFGAPHIRQQLYFVAHAQHAERRQITAGRNHSIWQETGREKSAGVFRERGEAGDVGNTEGRGCGVRGIASRSSGRAALAEQVSFWSDAAWIPCRDGKARPVEPGTFPLAHGIAGRVGRLRGYGNALCAPQAEAFIRAYLEARCE